MDNTIIREAQLVNKLGMHARAAAEFVKQASRFDCEINIAKNGTKVNGKSIMGILMLAMPMGESFEIHASGEDAPDAIDALVELVNNKFGEEQ